MNFEEDTEQLKGDWLAISSTNYAKGVHFKYADYVITLRRVEVRKVSR